MKAANKAKEEFIKAIAEVEALGQHAAEVEKMKEGQKQAELAARQACEYAESIVEGCVNHWWC